MRIFLDNCQIEEMFSFSFFFPIGKDLHKAEEVLMAIQKEKDENKMLWTMRHICLYILLGIDAVL